MNLKLVLRTYSALRQLSDDESALLNTLRSLNESEREQLVESLAPVKATAKKPRKKREVKSSHAQSLSSAIQRAPKGKVSDADDERCGFIVNPENQEMCSAAVDDPIHDLTYSSSHEFQPGKLATQAAAGD